MSLRLLFFCIFLFQLLFAQGVIQQQKVESAILHSPQPDQLLMNKELRDGPWTDFSVPLFFQAIDPDSQPVPDVDLFLMRDVSFLLCEACKSYSDDPEGLNPDLITKQAKRLQGHGSSTDNVLMGTYHLYALRDDMGLPVVVGHKRFSIPGPHTIMIQIE